MKKRWACLIGFALGFMAMAAAELLVPWILGRGASATIQVSHPADSTRLDPNAIVVLAYVDHRQGRIATARWPRVAFAIGDGTLLLTAGHCVADLQQSSGQAISGDIMVISPYYGDIFGFRIVAIDKKADLAILKPAWASHPALALATEEELHAATEILIASRPQSKKVLGDLQTELLPVIRVDETRPNGALQLRGTEQVAPGWSGSPTVLPGSGRVAGVLTQLRTGTFRRMAVFRYKRSDALGCSVRSVRALLRLHGLEAVADRRSGKLDPVPDAERGFAAAIGQFQALFSRDDDALLESAREFARLRPRSVQAHLLLAIALAATKGDPDMPTEQRLDLVESNYKKALEIDPNNAYAHAAYGSFLVTLDRDAEALAQSEMALRIDPNDRLAYINRLTLLPSAQLVNATEQVIAVDPNDPFIWFHRSSALLNLGRREEALQAAQKAVALDPNGQFNGMLAIVSERLGKIDEAESHYKLMTERCGCQSCWLRYSAFLLNYRPDRLGEAEQAFKQAESKTWMAKVQAREMVRIKLLLLAKTSPSEGEGLAREWLRTDANDAEFWWFLADILRTQTKYAEAVVAARKAVDLKPNVSFQPRLANCLAKAGELQAAQQVYDEMLQRYPERGRYWFWYSQFLMDHHPDRVDEARQALETARTAADPNWLAPAGDVKKLQDRIDAPAPPPGTRLQDANDLHSSDHRRVLPPSLYSGPAC